MNGQDKAATTVLSHNRLIDRMDDLGLNELYCECGERLWPDCDISRVSILECFDRHRATATGNTDSVGGAT